MCICTFAILFVSTDSDDMEVKPQIQKQQPRPLDEPSHKARPCRDSDDMELKQVNSTRKQQEQATTKPKQKDLFESHSQPRRNEVML